jgi:hypothetical protein
MAKFTRRGFVAIALAASAARTVPFAGAKLGGRRILTLVYNKPLGMMRAVERWVP